MPYLDNTIGYRARDTSFEAAQAISPSVATWTAKVLAALETHGDLTPDEAADKLRVSVLTVRPRFTELCEAGRIVDTGLRRPNANNRKTIVWRLK
jgi:predicted ArsR family transcriptional regulator